MQILIAEDDVITRRTLEALLAKWGYAVIVVGDGAEAWRILQGDAAPRLAVLDWMMPGLDGIQICRQVRQRAEAPYVYVLLLTTKANQEDVISGLEAGADDYLTKPFNPQELMVRLRAGRRILDLQERLVAACEKLQVFVAGNPEADLQNSTSLVDLS